MEKYNLTQTGPEVQEILDGAAMLSDVNAEKERAEAAEQQEAETRTGADATLRGLIDNILLLIPSSASELNQLADKQYVAESITGFQQYVIDEIIAHLPEFKGQFTSFEQLESVDEPKAGDIGIVRTKDTDGHDVFTFYQYKDDQWNEFYSLSYHPQRKPATTGLVGEAPYNGMGRIELPMNWVEGWPNDTWLYYPYHDIVYLMYYWNGQMYAVYNAGTQEGLGLDDNLVVKPLDYNIADIQDFVGERYLPFTESSGVWTITKPDDSTITSTELNNTNIYKVNDPTHLGINVLTQEMINRPNTIYVIQHDYDLNVETITIPENCVLYFDGGSLNNGNIIFNNTLISGNPVLKNIVPDGTLANNDADVEWFVSNDYSIIIQNLSKSGIEKVYVNNDVICRKDIELYCNIGGGGTLMFQAPLIDVAVNALGEFDIDDLKIDCAGVDCCFTGFRQFKTYDSTRRIYHNITVRNIKSEHDTEGTHGIQYNQNAYFYTEFNTFNVELKCDVDNICGTPNGIVGDSAGSVRGLIVSLRDANKSGHHFVVHDSHITNVYDTNTLEGRPSEDADAVHLDNLSQGSTVIIKNTFISDGAKRGLKLQGNDIYVEDCTFLRAGVDPMVNNCRITGCVFYDKGMNGSWIINVSPSTKNLVIRDTVIYADFNHIIFSNTYQTVNSENIDIQATLKSDFEFDGNYAKAAITFQRGGENVVIDCDADMPDGVLVACNCSTQIPMKFTARGVCRCAFALSYANNLSIENCDIDASEYFVYSEVTGNSKAIIRNNNVRCGIFCQVRGSNDFSVTDNIVKVSSDPGEDSVISSFGDAKNLIFKGNIILSPYARCLFSAWGASVGDKVIGNILKIDAEEIPTYCAVIYCFNPDTVFIGNIISGNGTSQIGVPADPIARNNFSIDTGLPIAALNKLSGWLSNAPSEEKRYNAMQYLPKDPSMRKPAWWFDNKWIDAGGASIQVNHSGTWDERPTAMADLNEGFMYMLNVEGNTWMPIFAHNQNGAVVWYKADGTMYMGPQQ